MRSSHTRGLTVGRGLCTVGGMTERDKLYARIERFMKRHGMAPSVFGRTVLGDPSFVLRLRAPGKQVKSATIDRINRFMSEYEARPGTRKGQRARRFQTAAAA